MICRPPAVTSDFRNDGYNGFIVLSAGCHNVFSIGSLQSRPYAIRQTAKDSGEFRYRSFAFPSCSTEQALEFLVDPLVALARTRLQAVPVDDGAFSSAVTDQAFLLEGFEYLGDGGPPHAEHLGQELVRHWEH